MGSALPASPAAFSPALSLAFCMFSNAPCWQLPLLFGVEAAGFSHISPLPRHLLVPCRRTERHLHGSRTWALKRLLLTLTGRGTVCTGHCGGPISMHASAGWGCTRASQGAVSNSVCLVVDVVGVALFVLQEQEQKKGAGQSVGFIQLTVCSMGGLCAAPLEGFWELLKQKAVRVTKGCFLLFLRRYFKFPINYS